MTSWKIPTSTLLVHTLHHIPWHSIYRKAFATFVPHGYFSLFASCWLLLLNQSCFHQKNIIPTWIWVPGYSLLCVAIQPYCVGVWLGVAVQPFFCGYPAILFVAVQLFFCGYPAIWFVAYPAIFCGYPAISWWLSSHFLWLSSHCLWLSSHFLWLSSHLFEGIGCQSFFHFLKTFLK